MAVALLRGTAEPELHFAPFITNSVLNRKPRTVPVHVSPNRSFALLIADTEASLALAETRGSKIVKLDEAEILSAVARVAGQNKPAPVSRSVVDPQGPSNLNEPATAPSSFMSL